MTADHERHSNGGTIRQELWRVEDRLVDGQDKLERSMRALAERLEAYMTTHATVHAEHDTWSKGQLDEIMGRFQATALLDARRQGALGMLGWIVSLLGANWKGLAVLVVALLGALGFLTIDVGGTR